MLTNRIFTGLLLIGIGAVFLAAQLGFVSLNPGKIASTYWPVALILVGLHGLLDQSGRSGKEGGSRAWGGLLVLLGAVFLLKNLGFIGFSFGDLMRMLIPVVIILFGIRMLLKPSEDKTPQDYSYKYEYKYEYNPQESGGADVPPPPGDIGTDVPPPPGHEERSAPRHRGRPSTDERSGFFGDLYLGQDDWELRPMNVSHFIGDTIIDLTKARVPLGETKLNISSFIGDVKVLAPNDIDVEISVSSSSLLGDITIFKRRESGFMRSVSEVPPNYHAAEKRIRLQISLFIGDVIVQRVG